jgi:exodeoxyribonuclease VII small subunit
VKKKPSEAASALDSTPSFEQQLARLDSIVQTLDTGNAPLNEMLALYEEGMMLAKQCSAFLSIAEQKILTIQEAVAVSGSSSKKPADRANTLESDENDENDENDDWDSLEED